MYIGYYQSTHTMLLWKIDQLPSYWPASPCKKFRFSVLPQECVVLWGFWSPSEEFLRTGQLWFLVWLKPGPWGPRISWRFAGSWWMAICRLSLTDRSWCRPSADRPCWAESPGAWADIDALCPVWNRQSPAWVFSRYRICDHRNLRARCSFWSWQSRGDTSPEWQLACVYPLGLLRGDGARLLVWGFVPNPLLLSSWILRCSWWRGAVFFLFCLEDEG